MDEKKRQDNSKRKRHNQISLRFSDEELEQLDGAIEKSGLTRTEFFMKLLQNSSIVIIPDLQEICIELKKQGVNLNQALRFAYQYGDNTELMKAVQDCDNLYDIAKDLCLATESKADRVKKRK